jgi:hypothetical protein
MQTKVILEEKMDETEGDEYDADMFLNKEEMQIIYNALSSYKPTANEEHLLSVLLEEFEEILVVDYNEAYPDANYSKFTG